MIRKSGIRFSEKIMLKQKARAYSSIRVVTVSVMRRCSDSNPDAAALPLSATTDWLVRTHTFALVAEKRMQNTTAIGGRVNVGVRPPNASCNRSILASRDTIIG